MDSADSIPIVTLLALLKMFPHYAILYAILPDFIPHLWMAHGRMLSEDVQASAEVCTLSTSRLSLSLHYRHLVSSNLWQQGGLLVLPASNCCCEVPCERRLEQYSAGT